MTAQDASFRLVSFTSGLLPAVRPWFTDSDVQRWLGGPDWPDLLLRLDHRSQAGHVYRGAIVLGAQTYVLLDVADEPVALLDTELYDRETVFAGLGPDGPGFTDAPGPHIPQAALTIVVDPARRRQGIGLNGIRAIEAHPDLAIAERFVASIEPDNHASQALFRAAGFRPISHDPDWEKMLTFARGRVMG